MFEELKNIARKENYSLIVSEFIKLKRFGLYTFLYIGYPEINNVKRPNACLIAAKFDILF